MILIDFSSIIHRMIYTSCSNAKPKKENGKYITSEFIGLTKRFILYELFNIKQEHGNQFGELVICLDESSNGYWRKQFYPAYKASRKIVREESEIDFSEVFFEINQLIQQLVENLPWKVVCVDTAEADDIILILAKEFSKNEKILIHSPDKDMIQAQRNENVYQYSSLTKKWIVPETKNSTMDEWIQEHICLGDGCDEVPKIVDHCEFSDNFLKYLESVFKSKDEIPKTPLEFKKVQNLNKKELLQNFKIYKTNRKGENIGILDIYKDIRFGRTNLKKEIKKFGSLDKWLDSNPLYREHYNRNFKLVMEEGIPQNIRNLCFENYNKAPTNYNKKEFENYLITNDLKSILLILPNIFKSTAPLTADDFGW
jgi:hypothetical protein